MEDYSWIQNQLLWLYTIEVEWMVGSLMIRPRYTYYFGSRRCGKTLEMENRNSLELTSR